MRTTLTLDDDVARILKDAVHRERRPFKQVLNDAIRRAFSSVTRTPSIKPYKVKPYHGKLRPGFDPQGFNRLADELEDQELIRKLQKR